MNEWEKAQRGFLYDANYDNEIIRARTKCADLCHEFNNVVAAGNPCKVIRKITEKDKRKYPVSLE